MLLLFFACFPLTADGDWSPEEFVAPSIETFAWECIEEEALWRFEVWSEGWTGNGTLWLMDSAQHLEEHPIYSIGAASDRSQDHLLLELPSVGDWRDAQKGKSTRFWCEESEELNILLKIYHPKTMNNTPEPEKKTSQKPYKTKPFGKNQGNR